MGIDGIGKGRPPGAQGASATDKTAKPEGAAAFHVDRTKPAAGVGATERVSASEASALERLRSGEIDVDRYLDLKVDEATRPLEGLSPADLADIKHVLRDQLASDPGLVDLVKAATGATPSLPEDG